MSIGSAYGQLRVAVGPQVGLNAATAENKSPDRTYNTEFAWRGAAGGTVNVGWQHWAGQASVLYAQKGFRVDDKYSDPGPGVRITRLHAQETFRLNYLTLPVNLAYTQQTNGQGMQVFAGGYVSRLLSGDYEFDYQGELQTTSSTIPYRSKGDRDVQAAKQAPAPDASNQALMYSRPWDFGAQVGVGYQWARLLVQLSYSRGLKNLASLQTDLYGNTVEMPSYKLRTVQLSAAYLLPLR